MEMEAFEQKGKPVVLGKPPRYHLDHMNIYHRLSEKRRLIGIIAAVYFSFSGCMSYPFTGKHVPIRGNEPIEAKAQLADQVLAAMPIENVRAEIQKRHPKLSKKQLNRIHLTSAKMNLRDEEGVTREEIHLIVTIYHDAKLHPVASDIEQFVVTLLEAELQRQRTVKSTTTP
jgi:hypothetical protein